MAVGRILVNGVIMALELALVGAVSWLGYTQPIAFAILTLILTLALGLVLERARLNFELPFYFGAALPGRGLLVPVVAVLEAVLKSALGGLVALMTFAGTEPGRLWWIALAFGLTVWAGASLLRWLAISFSATVGRWGYFRLAAVLGVIYAILMALLTEARLIHQPTLGEIGRRIIFETPERPGIGQVSELLFQVKLYIDGVIVALLGTMLPPEWARIVGVVVSVNVLTGFVAAIYALVVAKLVLTLEEWNG
ncbi:MAG: hypothetical protein AB1749_03250 [Pseudomonadota bacterium]